MPKQIDLRAFWIALAAMMLVACGQDPGAPAGGEPEDSAAVQPLEQQGAGQAQNAPASQPTAAAAAPRTDYTEGRHYRRLTPAQPTSSGPEEIEVVEVFWYGCPHCNEFEPHVRQWKETLADDVNFIRLPATWNPLLQIHARAYYTAESLGKAEEMHRAFFDEIHQRRNNLENEERIREFFARFDVSDEQFDRAWNSFDVQSRLQRAQQLAQRYRITGTPMVVVNGKYTTDGGLAGSLRELLSVTDELVRRERAER